jgi:tetratricopeptide (TPR) repeat protein
MWVVALSLCIAAASSTPRSAGGAPAPDPKYPSEEALLRYSVGRLLEERNQGEEALGEFYRALLLDNRSVTTAQRLSELSARLGDAPRSLEFADRAIALDSLRARAWWLRGAALFNQGRASEALGSLETAVAADSDQIDYLKTLARVGEELDRYDVVARGYRRVVELDDQDGEAWFQLAAAEARMGQFASAKSALREAVSDNPLRPGALFLEGWIEEGLGDAKQAIELYRRHLQVHAGDQVTRRRLVNLLADAHRYDEAYREAQELARALPDDEDVLEMKANLALKLGRASDGSRALNALARLAPDDPANLGRRLEVLARNKRGREAVALAEDWSARHPGEYHGPMLSARAHFLAGESEPAIAAAKRAVEMAPDSLTPRLLLGRIHQLGKRYAEAASVWTDLHARYPKRADIGLDLAFCRDQMGDVSGAESAARDVLKVDPENASALNFLGYILADHNLKLNEAVQLIERAVKSDPDNGAFVDSRGWVYYRLGRLEDARRDLERAVQLSGGDPVVCEHLGDVYKDMRLIELAREQYRRSLASDRSNNRVRSKLDGLR